MICRTITIGMDAVESSRTNRELRSPASHATAKIHGVTTVACRRTASQKRSRTRNQSGMRNTLYTIALGTMAGNRGRFPGAVVGLRRYGADKLGERRDDLSAGDAKASPQEFIE